MLKMSLSSHNVISQAYVSHCLSVTSIHLHIVNGEYMSECCWVLARPWFILGCFCMLLYVGSDRQFPVTPRAKLTTLFMTFLLLKKQMPM